MGLASNWGMGTSYLIIWHLISQNIISVIQSVLKGFYNIMLLGSCLGDI
jgi:hypothetical protein